MKRYFHHSQRISNIFIVLITLCIGVLIFLSITKLFTTSLVKTPSCKRCNIVLVVLDPLRADALSCYGYTKNTAPNLCAFAKKNLLLTNMYSHASWTLPSIMSLFSSQYPSEHDVFTPSVDVLEADAITLPMALKDAGYHTVFIGPTDSDHVPLDKGIGRGFDKIIPYTSIYDASLTIDALQKSQTDNPTFVFIHSFDLRANSTNTNRSPDTFVLDPDYTYGSVDPWLLTVPLHTPDSPATITYLRKWYDQIIVEIDQQLAILLTNIQSGAWGKNTIIAITSDHGTEFGEHGRSDHGVNLYATTTHVPFILSVPNTAPQTINSLTQSIDIYPSLLKAAGIPAPRSTKGIDIFSKYNSFSISQLEPEKHLVGIRTMEWSYYFDPAYASQGSIYNLRNDPAETRPLSLSDNAKTISELMHAYQKILPNDARKE